MQSQEGLVELINELGHRVTGRLKRFWRPVTLITYEGSLLDRLVFHFVRTTWKSEDYTLICSTRPCMQPTLIGEVESFSAENGYQLVGFQGDCSARFPWQESIPRSCENIGQHIDRELRGTEGLLLSSALLNETTTIGFTTINAELYSELYEFVSPELACYRDTSDGKDWSLLFPFRGFNAVDAVLAYLFFVSSEIEPHHLPLCYLDCYNEEEQRRMTDLVTRRGKNIIDALNRLAS